MKIPRTIGRYEVVDLISRGHMGALYRARDPRIGRYVAIKRLEWDYETPDLRNRFLRDAAAAGALSHPNIVTILEIGEDDGLPFIAMEYVRGETFTDVLGLRPPLSVLRKLQLVEEVCAGLAHAHEAGIVHRDIKPANLIVSSDGVVKILGFGIANFSSTEITLSGGLPGVVNYMAPEQVRGEAVDTRADVFAVGAVLYELLTQRQAFPGQWPFEVLNKILNSVPPPISEALADIDPRLGQLVELALEKNRNRRIPEIALLQKELANIRLNSASRSDPPATASMQRRTGLITPPPRPVAGSVLPASSNRNRAAKAQIEEHLITAEREFDAGNYDAAIEACKRVLMLDDSEERAIAQLDRIHAAFDEQQALAERRHQEVETLVATAAARLDDATPQATELALAVKEIERALSLDPEHAGALQLRMTAQAAVAAEQKASVIRASIRNARTRFANGKHQAAFQLLESLDPAANPLVEEALAELHDALLKVEESSRSEQKRVDRKRQLAAYISTARAAINAGRFKDALDALAAARSIDDSADGLEALTEQAQHGHSGGPSSDQGVNDDTSTSDADATRVLLPPKGTVRSPDEKPRAVAVAPPRDRDEDDPPSGTWSPEAIQRQETSKRGSWWSEVIKRLRPAPVLPSPVLFGISTPTGAKHGEAFVARFVAYVKTEEVRVTKALRDTDSTSPPIERRVSTGLTPSRRSRWLVGTPVLVKAYGDHLRVGPDAQTFEWNGKENLLTFLVTVEQDAPQTTAFLCFEAFIEGVPIFFKPVPVQVGSSIPSADHRVHDGSPAATAFASYSSQDDAIVKQCLSALKHWAPDIDVFMDCLDLTPNEDWKRQLERIIPTKDTFLLFWSIHSMQSKWVAWEIDVAESARGLGYIRPMPLDAPDVAPPPEKLKHLHFGDRYLASRRNRGRAGVVGT